MKNLVFCILKNFADCKRASNCRRWPHRLRLSQVNRLPHCPPGMLLLPRPGPIVTDLPHVSQRGLATLSPALFGLTGLDTTRVGRIAPNHADAGALRDSTIRQNVYLNNSVIWQFGNSWPEGSEGVRLTGQGITEGYTSSLSQAKILSSLASRIVAAISLFK